MRHFPATLARLYALFALLSLALPGGAAPRVYRESIAAYAQRVPLARFMAEAERAGRRDWPNPPERPGTRVLVDMSFRAASVSIVAPHAYGRDRAAALAERIVRDLRLPADIHAYEGRKTVTAEIDLSRAFRRSGFRLTYDVPLGHIAEALRSTDLPRPIVVGLLRTERPGRAPSNSEAWFGSLTETAARGTQHFEAAATWKAVPAAIMLFGGGAMCILLPWLIALRKPKAKPLALDPNEVQRRYDRQPSLWINLTILLAMVGGMMVAMMAVGEGMSSLMIILPVPLPTLMHGLAIAWPASWATYWLTMGRKSPARAVGGEQSEVEDWPEENPSVILGRSVALLLLPTLLTLALLTAMLPALPHILANHPDWRGPMRAGLEHFQVALFAPVALGAWLASRSMVVRLTSGRWYEMVHKLADKAGVRVRHVAILKRNVPNAAANAFGDIILTQGLVRQMEPDEIRAVIAHEIGHLKLSHPRRTTVILLAVLGALWLGFRQLAPFMDKHVPNTPAAVAAFTAAAIGILCILPAVLVGPLQRRREREADEISVQLTGDPNLVIRALTRMHHMAGLPGRLKPADEVLLDHPSLNRRIDAIRAAYPAAGRDEEGDAPTSAPASHPPEG